MNWAGVALQLAGLVVVVVGGLWAYTRYALERGLAPPVQFSVDATWPGIEGAPHDDSSSLVLEVILTVRNLGSSALVASHIRADVRYLHQGEEPAMFSEPNDPRFGRVKFPHSVRDGLLQQGHRSDEPRKGGARGFVVIAHDTFVQAGVTQQYSFITSVPRDAAYVLLWGSFEYAQRPYRAQRAVLWVSRRLGLIHFSLEHIRMPHTTENVICPPIESE